MKTLEYKGFLIIVSSHFDEMEVISPSGESVLTTVSLERAIAKVEELV